MSLPLTDFWSHFKTTMGLGWSNPVWILEMHGETQQTVISEFGIIDDPECDRYQQYQFQIACYHTNETTAITRAKSVRDAYQSYKGQSTAAPGLIFGTYRAEQVQTDYKGIVEAIEITNGTLYKAVTDVTMINVEGV
jgi:hypothetical protein